MAWECNYLELLCLVEPLNCINVFNYSIDISKLKYSKWGMIIPRTQEAETGGSGFQGHSQLTSIKSYPGLHQALSQTHTYILKNYKKIFIISTVITAKLKWVKNFACSSTGRERERKGNEKEQGQIMVWSSVKGKSLFKC